MAIREAATEARKSADDFSVEVVVVKIISNLYNALYTVSTQQNISSDILLCTDGI